MQRLFESELGFSIRIDRRGRIAFGDRLFGGLSIDSRSGREDDAVNSARPHAIEQGKAGYEIIAIILGRIRHRFADQRICRHMDDRFDFVLHQRLLQGFSVHQICFDQRDARRRRVDMPPSIRQTPGAYRTFLHNNGFHGGK